MIIGLDYGNVNTKTSTDEIFPSKIIRDEKIIRRRPADDKNLMVLGSQKVLIGEGELQTNTNKIDKELSRFCILGAIARSTKNDEVRIVMGLPSNQFNNKNKDRIKNELLADKIYSFTLAGEERTFIINDIEFFPEGEAPYYGMTKEQRNEVNGYDLIIVNIGGGNTNISYFKYENGKRKLAKSNTVMSGMIHMYSDFIDAINGEFSTDKVIEDAEQILKKGLEIYGEKQDIGFTKDIILNHVDIIFKDLNLYPVRTSKVMFTGGGHRSFKSLLKQRVPGCLFQTNYMMATAYGLKRVGEKLWQREYL